MAGRGGLIPGQVIDITPRHAHATKFLKRRSNHVITRQDNENQWLSADILKSLFEHKTCKSNIYSSYWIANPPAVTL
jgi:hypothetical protein